MDPVNRTSRTAPAVASRRQAAPTGPAVFLEPARPAIAGFALAAISIAFAIALAACGSTTSGQTTARSAASSATLSAHTSHPPSPAAATPGAARARGPRRSHIDATVHTAKATYYGETKGPKLREELGRIARDRILLDALSRGDLAGAQAETDVQLHSALNHTAHVTRISVLRGSRVLVDATVNSDGVFVCAPGTRALRLHGRALGTLLVSIQDITGFVKLVHNLTGAQVLARGASGRVRVSPGATARLPLPSSGRVRIAGRSYLVRSFGELGWGGERLTVWVLEEA
ncbi:MAG: hypothetical protein ACRDLF_13915 [Solirubrobacteraceae bacterium]